MKLLPSLVLASSLMMGCGGHRIVVDIPPPLNPPVLSIGLNDRYHGPIEPEVVDRYCGWGRDLTLRSPVENVIQAENELVSTLGCGRIHNHLIVEKVDLDLVYNLTPFVRDNKVQAVELGNELDLAGVTPSAFHDFLQKGYDILRGGGFIGDIITGGIYAVTEDTILNYLKPALAGLPKDMICGVHWYQDHDHAHASLIRSVCGNRDIAVTEFGVPSKTLEEDQFQYADWKGMFSLCKQEGFKYCEGYQRPSGPSDSNLDNFGIQRFDKSWKFTEKVFIEFQ